MTHRRSVIGVKGYWQVRGSNKQQAAFQQAAGGWQIKLPFSRFAADTAAPDGSTFCRCDARARAGRESTSKIARRACWHEREQAGALPICAPSDERHGRTCCDRQPPLLCFLPLLPTYSEQVDIGSSLSAAPPFFAPILGRRPRRAIAAPSPRPRTVEWRPTAPWEEQRLCLRGSGALAGHGV